MFGLKEKYAEWKEDRFLKKHRCDSREQYEHRFDPDINNRATAIRDYYHGYSYVSCCEPRSHYAYELLYDHGPGGHRYGFNDMHDWCKEHCQEKFRVDYHRVIKNYWNRWEMNEIGGGDHVFFAFKNKEDYFLFTLKWA